MLDILKKTYLAGLGLATLTREKVEEIVDELVKRGEVAEKDRSHVVQDLLDRARDEQKKLSSSVQDAVQKVIRELGVPTRKEYRDLLNRVEALEKKSDAQKAGSSNDSTSAGG
ncbi:MAG: phasin family protein [Acidobacteriota bacterium]|jgi:polyhydroxyalkanoate synthesis regulator phasin